MKNWFKVFFLFFILGLLVYSNSFFNKFLIDDYTFLNSPVWSSTKFISTQWDPYHQQALGIIDTHEIQVYYRPMQHMVLDFCYAAFKNSLWQYHLLNLFLFVFASSFVYLFIAKVTGNYNLAFLTGLFYLIHPINGIIVNYVSAIVFPFQVIFTLCTIWLLLESLERKKDRVSYFLSLLFSFLSLFWHESGVMIPFYICAVILLFRKDPLKEKALYLFPYFLIVFSYIVFRLLFLGSNGDILKQITLFHMTGWEYVANLFRVLMWYIFQLFYPSGVVMAWITPILHDHAIWYVLGASLLLMLFLLLFVRFAKWKILQMAIIWTVIGFAPVCLVAFLRPDLGVQIEPHWFIVSSIGFFILAAYFCLIVLDRTKQIGAVLLFILIFAWGSVSHANNQLWADQKTYALYWLQQAPDLKSTYFYLAQAYQMQGDLKESKKYFRLALSGLWSTDISSYIYLAEIDIKDGHFKEAESYCKIALKIDPNSAVAYNNLGNLYYAQGLLEQARENFDRSLMLNPFLLESRRGLAFIFLKRSEYHKAIDLCLKNLDIVNDDTDALLLIYIFIREKDLVNLKKYTYRIINSETNPGKLTYLGVFMSNNNFPELALDCFKEAMRVDPGYSDAYMETGRLFAKLGKYDEAINIWKIGSSIDPSDVRFKKYIANIEGLKLKK